MSVYRDNQQATQGGQYPQYSQAGGGQVQYPYDASRDGIQGRHQLAVQGQPGYQTDMDPSQYQTQGGGVVSINERGFRSGNFEELRRNQMQQKVGAMQGGHLLAVQGQPGYQTHMDSQYPAQGGFMSGNFKELRRNQQSPSSSQGRSSMQDDIDDVIQQYIAVPVVNVTDTRRPFDPNLVCPMCNKPFRIGEIQRFRTHVNQCEVTNNKCKS